MTCFLWLLVTGAVAWLLADSVGVLGAVAVFVLSGYLVLRWDSFCRRAGGRPWQAIRAARGWGRGVRELERRLGMEEGELGRFSPGYRETTIPKRSGGVRTLHVPDNRTKDLQRRILRRLLSKLRAHEAAHGFEQGRSIATNARPHAGSAVVVHLDVVDFFPTTSRDRVERYFRRVGWNAAAAALLTRLVTHEGGLPQGAPTSPRLSNLVNFGLDERLARLAERRRARYTRYADDITFSFEKDNFRRVRGIVQSTRQILRAHGYLVHKRKKLSIRRRHTRQSVTGLVVNERVRLPRETRRWLRAVRHRAATGGNPTLNPRQLQGWAALESMVERQGNGWNGQIPSCQVIGRQVDRLVRESVTEIDAVASSGAPRSSSAARAIAECRNRVRTAARTAGGSRSSRSAGSRASIAATRSANSPESAGFRSSTRRGVSSSRRIITVVGFSADDGCTPVDSS